MSVQHVYIYIYAIINLILGVTIFHGQREAQPAILQRYHPKMFTNAKSYFPNGIVYYKAQHQAKALYYLL